MKTRWFLAQLTMNLKWDKGHLHTVGSYLWPLVGYYFKDSLFWFEKAKQYFHKQKLSKGCFLMRYVSWECWKGGHIRGWALQVGPVDDEGVVGPVDAVEHHEDAREQIHRHLIIALASLLIINPIITKNICLRSRPGSPDVVLHS